MSEREKKTLVMKRKGGELVQLTLPNGDVVEVIVHETKNGHCTLVFRANEDVRITSSPYSGFRLSHSLRGKLK